MDITRNQKAFLEFIPVSQIRKTVLQIYALLLFLVPLMISYYFKKVEIDYQWWKVIVSIDAILIIISIPVLIKPKVFIVLFHLLNGFTSVFVSMLLFVAFMIESNLVHLQNIVNLAFSIAIYLIALFTENILIIRANFLKYPKSNNKMFPILVLTPIMGMFVYNLVENTFKINGRAIATFFLAVAIGIPIHSLYRGYIILKFKYKPSDS